MYKNIIVVAVVSADGDDYEMILWYGSPTKGDKPYFQPGPVSKILAIANLWHVASKNWTCAIPEVQALLNEMK